MQHGVWHRLCRCSRACPLPHRPCKLQDPWPRPWPFQKWHQPRARRDPCGSGRSREECNAVPGTGCAGVRGHARSHTDRASFKILGRSHGLYRNGTNPRPGAILVGAGAPAKNATQCLAPAVPVFAGKPAPTPTVQASRSLAKAMAFTGMAPTPGQARSLWERARLRRMQRSALHRLCRCSRACPLPHRPCKLQDPWPKPWPLQEWPPPRAMRNPCGSGRAREECDAVPGTGCADARGHARSHTDCASFKILGRSHGLYRNATNPRPGAIIVGTGAPAKNATQCLAPAVPVFAGKPAPTPIVQASRSLAKAMAFTGMAPTPGQAQSLWERVHPRRMQRGVWHRLCRYSRACPLPHRPCKLQDPWPRPRPLQKWHQPWARRDPCGSGRAREECNAVPGTGCADVHGSNPIHTNGACLEN